MSLSPGFVKKAPLEAWSVRERLWLAMAVSRCGAQNWVSVSRALRPLQHQLRRPPEWFGQRSCAAQYEALLERCQTGGGRRKKRDDSDGPPSLPQETILRTLTDERVAELRAIMAEESRAHRRLKEELADLKYGDVPEGRLRAMAARMDAEREAREERERERALRHERYERLDKEKERRRRRPPPSVPAPPATLATPATPSHASPLLTSLLRNAQPAQTPPGPDSQELEKIERIKSELQNIERNFIAGSLAPAERPPDRPERIDIDDIELKEEDVYTFSDIDLVIPPVSSMHKPNAKSSQPKRETDPEETAPRPDALSPRKPSQERSEERADEEKIRTESVPVEEDVRFKTENIEKADHIEKVDPIEKEVHVADGTVKEISFKQENITDEGEKSNLNSKTLPSVESNVETDDDVPIEVIKEDKPGKTKRDYSRKKTEKDDRISPIGDHDGTITKVDLSDEVCSDNSQESADKKPLPRRLRQELGELRSESPSTLDSLPNSPAPATPPTTTSTKSSSEQDKDYRIWKKSSSLVLQRLYALKYASLFHRPITDDHAPRYSQAVKKPMDLSTIRRNIEQGVIKNTLDFKREVLVMLTDALMYNRTDHRVYEMALDTIHEAVAELNVLLQAQSQDENHFSSRLTRPPRPTSRSAGPPPKRKRTSGSGVDLQPIKKRKADDE